MVEDRINDEYEVDLRDYLRVLWEGKWIILVTFLVAIGTALALSSTAPKRYQAETSLLILPPLSQAVGGTVGGTVFSPETYQRLAGAGDLLQAVIAKVYPNGGGPSPAGLRSSMNVTIAQSTAQNFPGRFPLYMRVTFTGTDPQLLQKLAQVWAQTFTEKNTQLFLSRIAQSYDYIKQNFDDVAKALATKEQALAAYQQQNPLPVAQAQAESLQSVYKTDLDSMPQIQQQLVQAEARLSALQAALAQEPEFFTITRGLSNDALWMFLSASGLTDKKLAALPGLTIHDQELNTTYVALHKEISDTKANIAALQQQAAFLKTEVDRVQGQLAAAEARITTIQTAIDQFDREIKVLQATYDGLAAKLQDAKVARAETAEPIKIIEQPILPTKVIAPNKKMNVAVAGVLGLFVGVLLAFFAHYLQSENNHKGGKPLLQPTHRNDAD